MINDQLFAPNEFNDFSGEVLSNGDLYRDLLSPQHASELARLEKLYKDHIESNKAWTSDLIAEYDKLRDSLTKEFDRLAEENAETQLPINRLLKLYQIQYQRDRLTNQARDAVLSDLNKLLHSLNLKAVTQEEIESKEAISRPNKSVSIKEARETADKIHATHKEHKFELGLNKEFRKAISRGTDWLAKESGASAIYDALDELTGGLSSSLLSKGSNLLGKGARAGLTGLKGLFKSKESPEADAIEKQTEEQADQHDETIRENRENTRDIVDTISSESDQSQSILREISQNTRDLLNLQREDKSEVEAKSPEATPPKPAEEESEGGGLLDKALNIFGGKYLGKFSKLLGKGGLGKLLKFGGGSLLSRALLGGGKFLGKGLGVGSKLLGGAGRLLGGAAKAIPGLGWAITAGMEAYDGYKGWDSKKAKALYGDDHWTSKAKSSLAHIGSGLTFGLANPKQVSDFFGKIVDGKGFLGKAFKFSPLGMLTKSVSNLFDFAKDKKYASLRNKITSTIKGIGKFFLNPIGTIFNGLNGAMDFLSKMPIVGNFFKGLKGVDVSAAKRAEDSFLNRLGLSLRKVFESVVNFFQNGFDTVKSGLDSAAQAGSDFLYDVSGGYLGTPSGLGNLVASHESKGNYNIANQGEGHKYKQVERDFSNMTIGQIIQLQNLPKNHPNKLFAVGKYQIIPDTLAEAVKKLKLSPDTKFTPAVQERIFSDFLIPQAGGGSLKNYLVGKSNDLGKANNAGAAVWASIQQTNGRGKYDGDGVNKALTTTQDFQTELKRTREEILRTAKEKNISTEEAYKIVVGRVSPSPIGQGGVSQAFSGAANMFSSAASAIGDKIGLSAATQNTGRHEGFGKCARGVFNALGNAGVPGFPKSKGDPRNPRNWAPAGIATAKEAPPVLQSKGFTEVSPLGPPQNGDVNVLGPRMQGKDSGPNHAGHIEIFSNGKWYSDFAQNHESSVPRYAWKRRFRYGSAQPNRAVAKQATKVPYAAPNLGSVASKQHNSGAAQARQSNNAVAPVMPNSVMMNPAPVPTVNNPAHKTQHVLSLFNNKPSDNITSALSLFNSLVGV